MVMDHNRDCIRAIDVYLRERYQIKVLFHQGELGYRHASRISAPFSILTSLGAGAAVLLLLGFLGLHSGEVLTLAKAYPLFFSIILLEVAAVIVFMARGIHYKVTGKSQYFSDTLEFLRRGELPPRQKKVFGRR